MRPRKRDLRDREGPDPRDALHKLNGLMITHFQELLPDLEWGEWIINAIILHRKLAAVEIVTLETSATLHKGVAYFSRKACKKNDALVKRLDAEVPLDDSYAGYCIRTGNTVWIDDLPRDVAEDPRQNKYRSFGYVGVSTYSLPRAEYVFPIRLRIGLSEAIWGVLNCEWYGEQAESPFQRKGLGQAVVARKVSKLLSVHARFLPAVIDPDEPVSGGDSNRQNAALFRYYAATLRRLVVTDT